MKILLASIVLVITTALTLPAQAAQIKFDVDALTGVFSASPLSGSFTLDTESQAFTNVDLTSAAGSFTSGFAIDNASGFGLADTSFLFSGDAELLFEITGFDRFMPALSVGESIMLSIFASQADEFNDGFVNVDIFSANVDIFQGNISATRLAELQVPAASISFLVMCIGGFLLKRRG